MVSALGREVAEHASPRGVKRLWRWFRAGLKTRDLTIAGCVLACIGGAVLVRLLTGWPPFRIIGGTEQVSMLLGWLGITLITMLVLTIRVHLGYDDLTGGDDNSTGGASGQW